MRPLLVVLMTGCAVHAPLEASTAPPADGQVVVTRGTRFLQYGVSVDIEAPPEQVWTVLTDADRYPAWNETVTHIDGDIVADGQIGVHARIAPDRVFELQVSTFDAPRTMVWEDGNDVFRGVRTFTLEPTDDGGTRFVMTEALSGYMFGMIEGSLPDFGPEFESFAASLAETCEAPAVAEGPGH